MPSICSSAASVAVAPFLHAQNKQNDKKKYKKKPQQKKQK